MTKVKIFTAAPLPFQGQKRNFIKEFKATLTEFREKEQIRYDSRSVRREWFTLSCGQTYVPGVHSDI